MDQTWVKKVKTRKPHKCWGCGEMIEAGSRVEYVTNVDAGQFMHSYWCNVCQKVVDGLEYWEREDGFGFTDIKNNYPEQWEAAHELVS